MTYTFGYDELGRKTTVQVGTQTLSTNVYENDRNGLLSEVQYGNDGKVAYTYDEFDRLTGVKYDGETADRYTYEYGANGEAAEVTDNALGRTTRTDYDLADRPCQTELVDNATGEVLYKTGLKYDKLNNLTMFSEQVNDETHKSEYTYDRDNRITQIAFDGGTHKVGYTYDELGRVTTRVAECGDDDGKVTSTYGYVDGGYGTNSTTPLVASIDQKGISFAYAYDSRSNITSETRTDASGNSLTTGYVYDALGQLIRVNDPHENATWVYNYDRGGNIISKFRYAYTTGSLDAALESIPYTYGDSNWKDKLTAYNGRSFTYDAIGNPLSDGVWTYEWEAGRKLKAMNADGTALTFKYDHNGLRTQKVVTKNGATVTTNYVLHGKLITHMTVGSDKLHFSYDAQSRPAKVSFNGEMYTYAHNLQGDIVGILDKNGNFVVEYKYDVWGKLLSTSGNMVDTLGKHNPFRYRAYVYDEESGLYYLRSRYYNPQMARFINADGLVGIIGSGMPTNMFVYCDGTPVVKSDANGQCAYCAVLVGFALLVVAVVITAAKRISEATKAAEKVNETAGKKVITQKQILKAAFNPIPEKIMSEISYRAEGWYYREKILFSYTEQPNQYVIYDLTPKGSIVRWDHSYEEYSLNREAPLYQFLDFVVEVYEDPTFSIPYLSELDNFLLGLLVSGYSNVRDITLPPTLAVSKTMIAESEEDKAYRKGFAGLY